jgi:hypothetical protein
MKDAISLYAEMNEKAQKLLMGSTDSEVLHTLREMNERLDQYIYRKCKPCVKCGLPIVNKVDKCKVDGNVCETTSEVYDWAKYYSRYS